MKVVIGFTGRKGVGKDTAAHSLPGFENVKFAGALKAMLQALLVYQGVDYVLIGRMLEGDLKETPSEFLGGRSPRYAMQTLGTEWGRDLMERDLWLGTTKRRAALFDKVAISDVRFPNEVDMIHALGGLVYRIERAGPRADDAHISEAGIDALDVDGTIANDFATQHRFAEFLNKWVDV